MIRRPSFTASIGPSPVLGFMAAIAAPFRGGSVTQVYRAPRTGDKSGAIRVWTESIRDTSEGGSRHLPDGIPERVHVVDPPPLQRKPHRKHPGAPHRRLGKR